MIDNQFPIIHDPASKTVDLHTSGTLIFSFYPSSSPSRREQCINIISKRNEHKTVHLFLFKNKESFLQTFEKEAGSITANHVVVISIPCPKDFDTKSQKTIQFMEDIWHYLASTYVIPFKRIEVFDALDKGVITVTGKSKNLTTPNNDAVDVDGEEIVTPQQISSNSVEAVKQPPPTLSPMDFIFEETDGFMFEEQPPADEEEILLRKLQKITQITTDLFMEEVSEGGITPTKVNMDTVLKEKFTDLLTVIVCSIHDRYERMDAKWKRDENPLDSEQDEH